MGLEEIMAGSATALVFGLFIQLPMLVYLGVAGMALSGFGMFLKAMGWA